MINVSRVVAVESGLTRLATQSKHVMDISLSCLHVCQTVVLNILRHGLHTQPQSYQEAKHAFRALMRTSQGRILSWISRFLGQPFQLLVPLPLGLSLLYQGLLRTLRRYALKTQIWIPPHSQIALGAFVIADYVETTKEHTDGDDGWGLRGLSFDDARRTSWCPEELHMRITLRDAYPPYNLGSVLMKEYPRCLG